MLFIALFTFGSYFELVSEELETMKAIRPDLIPVLPPMSVIMAFTGSITFWSIFRYRLYSVVPVARDKIMDSIREGIIIVNDLGRVIDRNLAVEGFIVDILERKFEIFGKQIEDILFAWPQWLSACKSMQAADFEIDTSAFGRKFFYRVKVYPLQEKANSRGTVSILYDITENKDREEELISTVSHDITDLILPEKEILLQNEQLEAIVKIISDIAVLAIYDPEGNIVLSSDGLNNLFAEDVFKNNLGASDKQGEYFYQNGREMSLADMPWLRVLRGEKIANVHFIRKNSNHETHFLLNGTPIYDKLGKLIYAVFFTLDITEQVLHKQLIPVIEQLQALNALKDKLFTVVAHDIRNPIATMVSLLDLLEGEKAQYSSESQEIIEAVKEQVDNTYTIVDNLLVWLKSQKEGLVNFPRAWELSLIIKKCINIYSRDAEAKDIAITSDIAAGMKVFADREMLEIVLRNLLSNAVKFTGQGGRIAIQAYESGHETIVAVRDSGIGIDAEKAQSLFREEYVSSTTGTAGEKGLGLGLLIVIEFVKRNKGRIWLDSAPGEGSIFCFSLQNPAKNNEEASIDCD